MKERKKKDSTSDGVSVNSSSASRTIRQNLAQKLKTKALGIKRQKENDLANRNDNKMDVIQDIEGLEVKLRKNGRLNRATPKTRTSFRDKRLVTDKKEKLKPEVSEETDSDDDTETLQQIYSATYVEDFMEYSETLGEQISRYISKLKQDDWDYQGLIPLLHKAMDDVCHLFGSQRLVEGTNKLVVTNIENLLLMVRQIGDNGVAVSEMVSHTIQDKLHQLDIDEKNMVNYISKATLMPKKLIGKSHNTDYNASYNRLKKASFEIHRKKPSILSPMTKISNPFDEIKTSNEEPSRSCQSPSTYSIASSVGCKSFGSDSDDRCSDSVRYRTCRLQNPPQYAPFPRIPRTPQKMATPLKSTVSPTCKTNGSQQKSSASSSKVVDKSHFSDADSSSSDSDSDQPTYCICDQESFGKMVGCDNELCPIEWFHFKCVGLKVKPKGDWFCPKCRGDEPSIMKPRDIFLQELAEYNKQKEQEMN